MARLTPTQRRYLEAAARNAGLVSPAPSGAALRTAKSLLARGLLLEARTQPFVLEWRRDEAGQPWCLGISTAGREAIGRTEPLLPDRSQVVTGRLVKIFLEAFGREPTTIDELETFILTQLRAGWRSK